MHSPPQSPAEFYIGDAPNIADISKMEAHTFHEPVSVDEKSHAAATLDKAVQAHFAPRSTRKGRVNGRAVQTRNTIIFSDYSSVDNVRDDEARWEGIPDSLNVADIVQLQQEEISLNPDILRRGMVGRVTSFSIDNDPLVKFADGQTVHPWKHYIDDPKQSLLRKARGPE